MEKTKGTETALKVSTEVLRLLVRLMIWAFSAGAVFAAGGIYVHGVQGHASATWIGALLTDVGVGLITFGWLHGMAYERTYFGDRPQLRIGMVYCGFSLSAVGFALWLAGIRPYDAGVGAASLFLCFRHSHR